MTVLSRAVIILSAGAALAGAGYAQANSATDSRPAFDVASVKPNKSGTGVDRIRNEGGVLFLQNVSLKRLIDMAYDIPEWQTYLLAGPDWLDSEDYDIQARYPADTSRERYLLMFQRLLEERFRMTLHREPKEFSVLALIPGKTRKEKLTLHPAAAPGGAFKFKAIAGHATGFSISMPMLAGRLSRPDFGLDRPVLDFTGIEGTFDLTLDWKQDRAQDGSPVAESGSEISIFAAVQEQLGLKLEPRRVKLDVLVIDRASKMPTEN